MEAFIVEPFNKKTSLSGKMMFEEGKFSVMEISIVERHVLEVYLSTPLFPLFIVVLKKVKVLMKVQNVDMNEKRDGCGNVLSWLNNKIKKKGEKRVCVGIPNE